MNTEKLIKEAKAFIFISLLVGIALFSTGLIFQLLDFNLIANNKALIGLSFIPFGFALIYVFKLSKLKKSPQQIKALIIDELDERLVSQKNEIDAKTFKLLQGMIFLTYMGYTLAVPADIFESIGWWILLFLFFFTFVGKAIISLLVMRKANPKED